MDATPEYIKITNDPNKTIDQVIEEINPDKIGILVDENTERDCLGRLDINNHQSIKIESGEQAKNIETCLKIWKGLTEFQFTRKSLLINLGGGVIGDMGGFVASTYKRGIPFINVPTTLLSQVDASIGGKLGVDFEGLKNHIGCFRTPDSVIIWEGFLETLPDRELRSGYAEVLKHGLIWDRVYWENCSQQSLTSVKDWQKILEKSVVIKSEVVENDPLEMGLRKILNFGHTIGHAIETALLNAGKPILHGEAIAAGMIMETQLSKSILGLSRKEADEVVNTILGFFGKLQKLPDPLEVKALLLQDKKNVGKEVRFSLLSSIGTCQYDQKVPESEINDVLENYRSL